MPVINTGFDCLGTAFQFVEDMIKVCILAVQTGFMLKLYSIGSGIPSQESHRSPSECSAFWDWSQYAHRNI